MNEFEGLSEYLIQEESDRFLKKITMNASSAVLWNRTPQGKAIAIRTSSMVPQFKLTSEALEVMWTVGAGVEARNPLTGFLVGHKLSPKHYLSVKLAECQWHISRATRPQGDYSIQLFPVRLETPAAEMLEIERQEIDALLSTIQTSLDSVGDDVSLEPLDLCRAAIAFSIDKRNQMLYMKCELVHPSASLHFTPIQPLKLVSSPLTAQLIQEIKGRKGKFQTGFLTLDQSKRVLPMLVTDPMAYRCGLVGMWATGIPLPSQLLDSSRYSALTHPLVWTAAIRYLQSTTIKDRVSPSPEQNTFLFIHFSANTKFYEVSTLDEAMWCTVQSCHEVPRERGDYMQPTVINFSQDGNTSMHSTLSAASEASFNSSFTMPLAGLEERRVSPTSVPLSLTQQSSVHASAASIRSSRPPKPEVEVSEDASQQMPNLEQVLRNIQLQIAEIQENMKKHQVCAAAPASVPAEKHFSTTSVNTSVYPSHLPTKQYAISRFATTGTNTSFHQEPDMVRTVKRQPTDIPAHRDEDVSYNPMRYSSSSANITIEPPSVPDSYLPLQSFTKNMKDLSITSSIDGFSQVSLPSLTKSQSLALPISSPKVPVAPPKVSAASPKIRAASPKAPREHVIESQTGGDATITIPKIEYLHDDGSEDEDEEDSEAVAKVERKYYRK